MAFTDDIGLLFTIKADNKQAKREMGEMDAAVGKSGSAFAGLANPAALAAIGITAVAAAAAATATAIFDLALKAGEYLSSIENAREKTGLMAETLSALRFGADAFGTSFESIEKSVVKFAKTVGDAANGSIQAKDALKRLGLDPQEAISDLDGALAKVFKRIIDLPPGVQQMNAAMDAFGKTGASLIPFLVDFNGDMDSLIKRARDAGLVFDQETVVAADKFEDTMRTAQAQVRGLGIVLGNEFLPTFTHVFKSVSTTLTNNKDEFKNWAHSVGNTVEGLYVTISKVFNLVSGNLDLIQYALGVATLGASDKAIGFLQLTLAALKTTGRASADRRADQPQAGGGRAFTTDAGFFEDEQVAAKAEAARQALLKKQADERENQRKRDLAANASLADLELQRQQKIFDSLVEYDQQRFARSEINAEQFLANLTSHVQGFNVNAKTALDDAFKFKVDGLNETEIRALNERNNQAIRAIRASGEKLLEQSRELVKKTEEQLAKDGIAQLKKHLANKEALESASGDSVKARLKRDLAAGIITQIDYDKTVRKIDAGLLQFRLENLLALQEKVKGNADEEAEVAQQITLLKENIEKHGLEVSLQAIEKELDARQKLLDLQREILDEERRLADFRAEQQRKVLENIVDSSFGKQRIIALRELVNFEVAEAERKKAERLADLEAEKQAALKRIRGKLDEEEQKFQIEKLYKEGRLLAEEEFQAALKAIEDAFNPKFGRASKEGGFLGGFLSGIAGGGLEFQKSISVFANALLNLGNVAGQVFAGIAQGIGSMVESWVLLGNAGGQSLRKFTAQVLASVAAQAAVLAIFELAKGFAALFFNPSEAAAHFTAAAIFGTIAGVAAVLGRAVAGNAFNNQNAAATSGQTQSTGQGSSTGGAFSSNENRVVEIGRNSGQPAPIIIKAEGSFAQFLRFQIETNSNVRQMLKEL